MAALEPAAGDTRPKAPIDGIRVGSAGEPISVPVVEIGGTHITAASVRRDAATAGWRVEGAVRRPLDSAAGAAALLDCFAAAAQHVGVSGLLGVALPGPFDVATGIARYRADKFVALNGVDVGAALRARLGAEVVFINDGSAFALGSWALGGGRSSRLVGITLGTGVGSGFVADGRLVLDAPGLPPGGEVHLLSCAGRPVEETFSRRALRRSFVEHGGDPRSDVREMCAHARAGDTIAGAVLETATRALGACLAPLFAAFGTDSVVVGGSMAASWDLLGPWFGEAAGLAATASPEPEGAALVGAAVAARSAVGLPVADG